MRHLFAAGRAAREVLDPFVPILVWHNDGDTGMTPLYYAGEVGIAVAAGDALDTLHGITTGPLVWFAVIVDAYGRITEEPDSVAADDLGDRFLLGDTRVVEQLMALVGYGGEVRLWRQVYRNTVVDGWEWDDPEWMVNPVLPDNGLLDVLQLHADDLA